MFRNLALALGVVGLVGCAEINIYVQDHSTATVTIEQDRTAVTTDAEIPLGTALQ